MQLKRLKDNHIVPAFLGALLLIYIFLACKNNVVFVVDCFAFFERGNALDFNSILNWVHGFYPFGYPLLVKLVSKVTQDYLISAKIISILAALVTCWTTYKISLQLFEDRKFALFSMLLLGVNSTFLLYAPTDNSDMITLVFMVLFLWFLLRTEKEVSIRIVIFTGVFLGLAYLMRYTALILVPPTLIWLIFFGNYSQDEKKIRVVVFSISFLLVALPQLILSDIVFHNPFYNQQHQNVWFGMYGDSNWGLNWHKAEQYTSLGEVVMLNPILFIKHVSSNLATALFQNLFNIPLHLLSFVGFFGCIISKETRGKAIFLFVLSLFYCAAISMAFVNERVIIFYLVIKIIFFVYGVKYLLSYDFPKYTVIYPKVFVLVLTTIVVITIIQNFKSRFVEYYRGETKDIVAISDKLHLSGMKSVREVMSLSYCYYDRNSKLKSIYPTPWYKPGFKPFVSMDDLRDYMIKNNMRYLAFDCFSSREVPGLNTFWTYDNFSADFMILHQNGCNGLLKIKDEIYLSKSVATLVDFELFLASKPFIGIDANSYSGKEDKDKFFYLFQENADWSGEEWHRDNILPLWIKYKEQHGLL